MSEIIILLIFLFFAVLGASRLTARLWLFLVRPRKKEKTFMVTHLGKDNKEDSFMYFFEKYRWYGKEYADYLLFICEEQPGAKIESFIKAHQNIIYCNENQVSGIIKKISEDKDEPKYSAERKA